MSSSIVRKLLVSTHLTLALVSGGLGMDMDGDQLPIMGKQGHNHETFYPGNVKAIEKFRDFYRQHGSGEMADNFLAEHLEIFTPFASYLLKVMQAGQQNAHIEKLEKEVRRILDEKAVSAIWLVDTHFRYLALLNAVSEEEKDVFFHVPYHNYLSALLETDRNGHPVVIDPVKWLVALDRKGEYFYRPGKEVFSPVLSKEAQEQIDQEIAKRLPSQILYPVLGEDVFTPEFILNNWIDEIYLIGMPLKNLKNVHGEEASPLGFAFHDLFHFKLDERRASLLEHTYSQVSGYVGQGYFASDIIPHIVLLAIEKYSLIREALRKAHESVKEDQYARAGEFAAFHEVFSFPEALFGMSNPVDVLKAMLKGSLSGYDKPEAWENPEDVLETSPVTGESLKSDEDIKEIAFSAFLEDPTIFVPYEIYYKISEQGGKTYVYDPEEQKPIKAEWLRNKTRFGIKKSPQFIDATFTFPNGEKKTYTFPTLVRKWNNIGHSLAILGFAGIDIQKPVLIGEDPNADRQVAIGALTQVRLKLQHLIQAFGEKAQVCFGEGEGSYTAEYALKFDAIEARKQEIMNSLKPQ